MSKEKAIALLGTAKTMESKEDMRTLIAKALVVLRDEPETVAGMELAEEMIAEAHDRLKVSLPQWDDTPQKRAEKIAICESALLQIKEYAAAGLKTRTQGSQEVAELLVQGKLDRSLDEYGETKVSITGPDGHTVHTTAERFNRVAEAVHKDPRIVALEKGEGAR